MEDLTETMNGFTERMKDGLKIIKKILFLALLCKEQQGKKGLKLYLLYFFNI